jgi:AcrR family transcriptional regulator
VSIRTEQLPRPLRADARRNRERILKAARAVFAAKGRDAHLEDVARRAKVGVGTVYRHFPTKDALLEALAREQFDTLTLWAREAEDAADPWEAFNTMMWRGAELQASDRALMEAVAEFKPSVARQAEELHASIARLMARAQEQGAMRADASVEDVQLMMCGLGTVMQMPGEGWRRYLTVMLDGLRA